MLTNNKKTIFKVSQLTQQVQQLLEASYRDIWVEAEISNLSKPASGHWYFSIKDANSQLRCAMFRNRASLNRHPINDGDLVRVRGKLTVYSARGDMQLIVSHIEPAGAGALQQRYLLLKNKLQLEGLFSQDKKRKLPKVPKRIGVITSPSGAAIQDVLTTLKRRFPAASVLIYPAVVQGEKGADSIRGALNFAQLQNQCDVLLVTRGGGSLEDLWCFNEEAVVREIANCHIPIMSAVGHEVDVTLSDFAADLRAPTPTAAAELLTPDKTEMLDRVKQVKERLIYTQRNQFLNHSQSVDWLAKRIRHPRSLLQQHQHRLLTQKQRILNIKQQYFMRLNTRLEQLQSRISLLAPNRLIQQRKLALESNKSVLINVIKHTLDKQQQVLKHYSDTLNAVSYHRTLDRGYAIVQTADANQVLGSQAMLNVDDEIMVVMKDGSIDAKVIKKSN